MFNSSTIVALAGNYCISAPGKDISDIQGHILTKENRSYI